MNRESCIICKVNGECAPVIEVVESGSNGDGCEDGSKSIAGEVVKSRQQDRRVSDNREGVQSESEWLK